MNVSTNLGFTAKDIAKAVQRGDVIIVIDVLRCCSTIVTALANAADGVIPTKTVREARVLHKKHPEFLLVGERKGIKPKGFDFGNSPLEFSSNSMKNKHVILTTSNGTKAICSSANARWVLIGAFLNAEAVAKTAFEIAEKATAGISFVLSGTHGCFSLEDFICAGAIVENLPANGIECSDAVLAALLAFRWSHKQLAVTIQSGSHARYLKGVGHEEDVKFCCQLDICPVVPMYKAESIVLVSSDGDSAFR